VELQKLGFRVGQQTPLNVTYEGHIVGEYYVDLWVEDRVIVEVKACDTLASRHEVQLVNYLAATGVDTGLLLNFGTSVQAKRKFREYTRQVITKLHNEADFKARR
jgi:GxxExxY protein